MALSDLAVFNEYAYDTYTEVLQQQVNLFNAATKGGMWATTARMPPSVSEFAYLWA